MRIELLPPNEDLRLQDLYSFNILDTDAEKEFDDMLKVVSYLCNCPMAAIAFIDTERQWFKSTEGISLKQTSREDAFCAHTILQDTVMVVKDATLDDRFSENPYTTGEAHIRFYAGAPIVSASGYNIGSVCVLDNQPRELQSDQLNILKIISGQVSRLLELRLKNKVLKQRSAECLQLEKELLQRTVKNHDEERSHISNELHENIAQNLAATKFYLELAEGDGETKDEWIRKGKFQLDTTIKQVRELSKSITPTTLKEFDLKDILEVLVGNFMIHTGIKAVFFYEGRSTIEPTIAMAVYRIMQDHLSNTKQHAGATEISINVNAFNDVCLVIKDNGVGIDLKEFKKGVGVNRILSRVENLRGQMDISSKKGEGCQLTITIPAAKSGKKKLRQASLKAL